jgi:hypothetical protein
MNPAILIEFLLSIIGSVPTKAINKLIHSCKKELARRDIGGIDGAIPEKLFDMMSGGPGRVAEAMESGELESILKAELGSKNEKPSQEDLPETTTDSRGWVIAREGVSLTIVIVDGPHKGKSFQRGFASKEMTLQSNTGEKLIYQRIGKLTPLVFEYSLRPDLSF